MSATDNNNIMPKSDKKEDNTAEAYYEAVEKHLAEKHGMISAREMCKDLKEEQEALARANRGDSPRHQLEETQQVFTQVDQQGEPASSDRESDVDEDGVWTCSGCGASTTGEELTHDVECAILPGMKVGRVRNIKRRRISVEGTREDIIFVEHYVLID